MTVEKNSSGTPRGDGEKLTNGLAATLRRWWRASGGLKAQLRSGYVWLAVALTVATYGTWTGTGWWDAPLAVLPSLLGFSLGSYAVLFSLGDDGFRRAMNADPKEKPYGFVALYLRISGVFLNFIFAQVAATLIALLARGVSLPNFIRAAAGNDFIRSADSVVGALGYFGFLYSLVLVAGAALSVYQLTEMYSRYLKLTPDPNRPNQGGQLGTQTVSPKPTGPSSKSAMH